MYTLAKSIVSASLLGLAALTAPASAADIYDNHGPRAASPYDDPRYADIYSHPSQPPRHAEPRYVEPLPEPHYGAEPRYGRERPYAYRDETPAPRDRHGYLKPINPRHQGGYAAAPVCVHQSEIRRSLVAEGWRDFQDLDLRGDVALLRARRPGGQAYDLKVDRCSGEIVHARPLEERPVPYAYRDRYGERAY